MRALSESKDECAVACPVGVSYLPQHPAGIADGDHPGRDVTGDYASRSDDGVVPDGDIRQYDGAAANPYAVADADVARDESPGHTLGGVQSVVGVIKSHIRTDEHLVADMHVPAIEYHAAEIYVHFIPNRDVLSELAAEIRFYPDIPSHGLEKPPHNVKTLLRLIVFSPVVFAEEFFRLHPAVEQITVEIIVDFAGLHFFPICHRFIRFTLQLHSKQTMPPSLSEKDMLDYNLDSYAYQYDSADNFRL